ncbi:non-ribosomal peptide synthetase [Streptomyces sp. NPDC002793]|uniref:non-ribosomal peptide synthetase n=1 Tax=Streptomyces sp. NPDC002793 TaxID=3154432 RepID=UPI003330AD5D
MPDAGAFAHSLVRESALARPEAVALTDGAGSRVTYRELLERWERLAATLRAWGVGPEVPVAVRLERSPDLVVAMLAILETGGVYAPIDDSCPDGRFAAIVEDLGAPVLLTDRETPQEVSRRISRIAHPREPAGLMATGAPETPALHPDNLAYVISTSGSTGRPKGVAMTHRGLNRLIRWQAADGPAGLSTVSFTSTGFDVTFQEVLGTLGTGGRLCMVSEEARRDPEQLLAVLEKEGIERVFLPYVALGQLALAARRTGRYPSSLRQVVTAGEQVVITDAVAEFFGALPHCRLDNHYGPTETHLVTSLTLDEDRGTWPRTPPIGRDVDEAVVHLLGPDLTPVAPGEPGEIHVGGTVLARGYLNAPAQTADRFLPDPFSTEPGARMYRTGDLGRLDAGGLLHFLGRADDQMKVRGYRIEPAEVELALSRCPGVREAAVGVRELGDGIRALVAYVVAEQGARPSVSPLSASLREMLPSYMVPARFAFIDAIPLSSTGKADRRKLAEVPLPEPADHGAVRLDGEATADAVAAVWQRVLGHDEFERDEDFFDVGGDSLLAAWVVTELSQLAGREIELSVILRNTTVEELAAFLATEPATSPARRPDSELITLKPGSAGNVLYLFHPLGGELLTYRELARRMESPVRVLGVRWAAGPAEPGHEPSLAAMARSHHEQLRAVQPEGPYLLAGWSFGGVLALEVGRLLRESGQEVAFLGLIDANPVLDPLTGVLPSETPYAALLSQVLEEVDRRAADGEDSVDISELSSDRDWVGLMGGAPAAGVKAAHLRRSLAMARQSMQALAAYTARPYGGDADLFQAGATGPGARAQLEAGLRGVVGGTVRVHEVPGDHTGILVSPHVTVLAEAIDAVLENIGKGNDSDGS